MKTFLLWFLLSISLWGQGVIGSSGAIGVSGEIGASTLASGTLVSVNVGQTIASQAVTDSGFQLFVSGTQFTTPTPSSGTITISSAGIALESPGAGNWGLAIYNDSANAPSTLVANCSASSSSTPSAHSAVLTFTGCVVSSASKYWVAFITNNNTELLALSSKGGCDSSPGIQSTISNGAIGSFSTAADFPSTFPANTAGGECIGIYATIQYTTSNPTYLLAGKGVAVCAASVASCSADVAPIGTGHELVVGNVGVDLSAVATLVSSFADSASDTITRRGTCNGTTTISDAICLGSVDQATAGTNTITANYGGTALAGGLAYAEVIGTAASSSFDQVEYDTARLATPFTSGNTPSTTQANEVLFGIADNTLASSTFTASGGWSILGQATTATGNNVTIGWFTKTISSTGTQNLSGSYGSAGTSNLPGLASFK